MHPQHQQCNGSWPLTHGKLCEVQKRQCSQPSTLLLASISSSISQQQQQLFFWPWSTVNSETARSIHDLSSNDIPAAASTRFCAASSSIDGSRPHPQGSSNPFCVVAALPANNTPEQHVSEPSFQLPHHQVEQRRSMDPQQQLLQQQPPQHSGQQPIRPSAGAQFASATFIGNGNSRPDGPSGNHEGPPLLGLKALGKAINGEAGKMLGILGAQLLMHVANLQRGLQALQQHQQGQQDSQQQRPGWRPRMPWQRQQQQQQQADAYQQSPAWQASAAAKQWVSRGIQAEARMDLREALACYTNAVTLEPGDVELICRLAKQWSDLTYEDGVTVEQIQEVNQKAIEYAERAIAMAPQSAGGYMASCVSRGRLALFSDNKTKVRLAKEAQEAARTALSLEPDNDLAHHLMGRWHFEMAQINFVVRQLIKLVYGAALAPGKFEDALMEFETAVRLNPTKLIHRVELGRSLLRMGHKREAFEQLTTSMQLEVEDINALLQKEDAELLLDKLKGEFERSVSWGGFSSGTSATAIASGAAGSVAAAAADAVAEESKQSSGNNSSNSSQGS